jgi:lysophospholipase L1-like esterase
MSNFDMSRSSIFSVRNVCIFLTSTFAVLLLFRIQYAFDGPAEQEVIPANRQPFRAMILGDSISHGRNGSHTWRYRLFSHLSSRASLVTPTFVGPYNGTFLDLPEPDPYPHDGGVYAPDVSSEFLARGTGHGAAWGRPVYWTRTTAAEWAEQYQPDWIMMLMGYNDFAWMDRKLDDVVDDIKGTIDVLRRVRGPDIKILVANVPDQNHPKNKFTKQILKNTRALDKRLQAGIPLWREQAGPNAVIEFVDVRSSYACRPGYCPDGDDGLHPNEKGQWHIARVFSVALVKLGVLTKPMGKRIVA